MIKDYLIENQPIFYQIIKNQFENNKIPHAFILSGNNTEKALQFLAMSFICDQKLACEQCVDCQKVLNHKYADMIVFDGLESSIKKTNIEYIQETFNKTSLEGKNKLYILKNIEYSSKEAMNTLLKMLEEPIPGIYSIFTTKNMNKVLPTIRSRCEVIELKPDSQLEFVNRLIEKGIDQEKANILSDLTRDVDAIDQYDDEKLDYIILQVINFVEDLFTKRENLIINTQTNLLKTYKDKDSIKLFLRLLTLALKDMFHVKHNQEFIYYVNHIDLFKSLEFDNDDIIKKIELVLETLYLIDTNANISLLMDSMMFRL